MQQNKGDPWGEGMVASLRGLWREGLPTRKIGGLMGITKNAVIGKAHRLGLAIHADANLSRSQRSVTERPPRPRRENKAPFRVAKKLKPPREVIEIIDDDIPMGQRRQTLELTDMTCRWPIGDPCKGYHDNPDFYFCGALPDDGSPYCSIHRARSRRAPRGR